MNEFQFPIAGMHCSSCTSRVKSAIEALDEVQSVSVSLSPPAATILIEEPGGNKGRASLALRSRVDSAIAAAGDYSIADPSLSKTGEKTTTLDDGMKTFFATYRPLILVVGFLLLACCLVQFRAKPWSARAFAADFMGGFFLAFAFFKLLDWEGFAKSFAMYDIVAKRSAAYAHAYPLVEVALGIAYLARWQPTLTNTATLTLMIVGSIGVWQAVRANQKIQCACLGTVFDLPMSSVTVIENGTMALMAIVMLVSR